MKAALSLMLCATVLLAGCTVPWLTTRKLQAEDRIVTGVEREVATGNTTEKVRIVCPEPSPDALKAIAASGSLSKADVLAISGAYQESGANIGLRTQSIQLLRDQLYSLCQAYANGVINRDIYMMYLTRNQRNTIAILAIEQLTGVTKGSTATVSGVSSVTVTAQDVQRQAKLLEAAKAQLKTLDANSAPAKDLQKLIDEEQAKLDKANAAIVTAIATGTATNVAPTGQPDAASVAKIADVVQTIAASVTSANDIYYLCLDAYRASPSQMPGSLKTACDIAFVNLGKATAIPINQYERPLPPPTPQAAGKKEQQLTPPRHTTEPERPKWQTHTPFNDI